MRLCNEAALNEVSQDSRVICGITKIEDAVREEVVCMTELRAATRVALAEIWGYVRRHGGST